jgi:hypothetical protein
MQKDILKLDRFKEAGFQTLFDDSTGFSLYRKDEEFKIVVNQVERSPYLDILIFHCSGYIHEGFVLIKESYTPCEATDEVVRKINYGIKDCFETVCNAYLI